MNAAKHLIFPLRIQQWMHKDHEEKNFFVIFMCFVVLLKTQNDLFPEFSRSRKSWNPG